MTWLKVDKTSEILGQLGSLGFCFAHISVQVSSLHMSTDATPHQPNEMLIDLIQNEQQQCALLRLIVILKISTKQMQTMLCCHANSMTESEARAAVYRVIPIDAILPFSIMQYIASFDHGNHQTMINKSWSKYYQKNNNLIRKLRQKVAAKYRNLYSPPFMQEMRGQRIFMVRPDQGKTRSLTINLTNCLEGAHSGDQIWLQRGTYTIQSDRDGGEVLIRGKDVQIIGRESGVFVECTSGCIELNEGAKLLLRNVTMDLTNNRRAVGIIVGERSELWVEQCELKHRKCVIMMKSKSRVHMVSARLIGDIGLDTWRIYLKDTAIYAADCLFEVQRWALFGIERMACFGCVFTKGMVYSGSHCNRNRFIFVGNVFEDWSSRCTLNYYERRNAIVL